MSGQVVKNDVAAREARELIERASAQSDPILALAACDMTTELMRAGYRFIALLEPTSIPSRPVRMRARYDGLCASCGDAVRVDDPIFWTRGADGVECAKCGGRA